jgi:hypothetical protein
MAIISIPTSIGGINIPGALVNGPLGSLYSNTFGAQTLQYPRDLQSMTRGHVVHFTIKKTEPTQYGEAGLKIANAIGNIKSDVTSALTSLGEAAQTISSGIGFKLTNTGLSLQPKREKIVGNIFLYMPDTLAFDYNSIYNSTSVKEIVKDLVPKGVSKEFSGMGEVATAVLAQSGYAINPQMQLFFEKIDFRSYQMVFTFTPYSKQETEQVKKIIQMFRENAAPTISTGTKGMFFVAPSSFTLDFMFNGKPNPYITKVTESVIKSIDVNYAPNGYTTHDDGSPVQIQMTLQFQEIQLVDSAKIRNGY